MYASAGNEDLQSLQAISEVSWLRRLVCDLNNSATKVVRTHPAFWIYPFTHCGQCPTSDLPVG
jgi:hypothetical protein